MGRVCTLAAAAVMYDVALAPVESGFDLNRVGKRQMVEIRNAKLF